MYANRSEECCRRAEQRCARPTTHLQGEGAGELLHDVGVVCEVRGQLPRGPQPPRARKRRLRGVAVGLRADVQARVQLLVVHLKVPPHVDEHVHQYLHAWCDIGDIEVQRGVRAQGC